MDTIKLNLHVPATVYPTLTVALEQWKRAKESIGKGISYTLVGAYGGTSCRGDYIPAGLHSLTLKRLEEEGCWLGEMEMWGEVRISLSCEEDHVTPQA